MQSGHAFKFGSGISTDQIIPGRYAYLRSNLPELAKHAMEDADPNFVEKVHKGDFIVAGSNFGLGSSREHAPLVIKMAGIKAIMAKSVARIFFRNSINLGLPVLLCDTESINEGDELEIDFKKSTVFDRTKGSEVAFNPLPDIMLQILDEGGLLPYLAKYGDFRLGSGN